MRRRQHTLQACISAAGISTQQGDPTGGGVQDSAVEVFSDMTFALESASLRSLSCFAGGLENLIFLTYIREGKNLTIYSRFTCFLYERWEALFISVHASPIFARLIFPPLFLISIDRCLKSRRRKLLFPKGQSAMLLMPHFG